MSHTAHAKNELLARVSRIRGQIEGLEKALNEGRECAAILQQIAAVRGAIGGLMNEVLEGHIREHLAAPDISPEQRNEDVEAVISTLRSYLR